MNIDFFEKELGENTNSSEENKKWLIKELDRIIKENNSTHKENVSGKTENVDT